MATPWGGDGRQENRVVDKSSDDYLAWETWIQQLAPAVLGMDESNKDSLYLAFCDTFHEGRCVAFKFAIELYK